MADPQHALQLIYPQFFSIKLDPRTQRREISKMADGVKDFLKNTYHICVQNEWLRDCIEFAKRKNQVWYFCGVFFSAKAKMCGIPPYKI